MNKSTNSMKQRANDRQVSLNGIHRGVQVVYTLPGVFT